jgi:hypothetical protein
MYPLNLYTYQELPMTIEAVPEKGYRFSHWVNKSTSDVYSYNILLSSPTGMTLDLEAVFEPLGTTTGISLNELAPSGVLFQDEDGENSGFIELYNSGTGQAILNSWFLSDRRDNLTRYTVPDSLTLAPGGFLVFYADGDARQGKMHTPFRLSTNGETVFLSQKIGEEVQVRDSIRFDFLVGDHSYGRYSDGSGAWRHMVKLTPGMPNDPLELKDGPVIPAVQMQFRIYPNPTAGQVFISLEPGVSLMTEGSRTGEYYVDLVNLAGIPVCPRIWLNEESNCLDMGRLDNGLYIVRIFRGNRLVQASRLILMK